MAAFDGVKAYNMESTDRTPSVVRTVFLALVALLLSTSSPQQAWLDSAMAARDERAQTELALASLRAEGSDVFRTHVSVDSKARVRRFGSVGATVLAAQTASGVELVRPGLAELEALASTAFPIRLTIAVNDLQMERLARLSFRPTGSDAVGALTLARGDALAAIAASISLDSDGDELTDTEEGWWCTDPLNANTDGDAQNYSDGLEVRALLDSRLSRTVRWGYGPPFGPPNAWPDFNGADGNAATPACNDGDFDTVPDKAEAFVLGTNPLDESTDKDKFDDGQEFFGVTYCPGGAASCGYGSYPRIEYWNFIKATMPAWVLPPGDSPFVAAFPVPEIGVSEGSWNVERVRTVTTSQGGMSQVSKTYGSEKRKGQSTSVADQKTWNNWESISTAIDRPLPLLSRSTSISSKTPTFNSVVKKGFAAADGIPEISAAGVGSVVGGVICAATGVAAAAAPLCAMAGGIAGRLVGSAISNWLDGDKDQVQVSNTYQNTMIQQSTNVNQVSVEFDSDGINRSLGGIQYAIGQQGQMMAFGFNKMSMSIDRQTAVLDQGLSNVANAILAPRITETRAQGTEWGGSQTTTNEEYEEHAFTESEAFATAENWNTAWTDNSADAGRLTFTYTIRNTGTEYFRELTGLIFNVYLGDDLLKTVPAWEQFPAGKIENFFPATPQKEFMVAPIVLSLEQMKRIDLAEKNGETLRVVLTNATYGADEAFYQDAISACMTIYVEDGVHDNDESVETYVMATHGVETVEDVITRYFRAGYDDEGRINSIWTPEIDRSNPSTAPVWNEHFLSNLEWWNVYFTDPNAASSELHEVSAQAGGAMLIRINRDSDRDGYQDRVEWRYGTDRNDPVSHPNPELLAGYVAVRDGNAVTVTLALENTGNFDAYGVMATMVSPDGTTTVTDGMVGGNGRVRPGRHVAVGATLRAPVLVNWSGSTAKPFVLGDYTGGQDRVYTFTTSIAGTVGQASTTMNWAGSHGPTGTVQLGSTYRAPLPVSLPEGIQVGFNTGYLAPGAVFTFTALAPRDTLRYVINATPGSEVEPQILVSYNSPQGNRKFVTPVRLNGLGDSLVPFAGRMLQPLELGLQATGLLSGTGGNTTRFSFDWPSTHTLQSAKLFLDFMQDGERVLHISRTLDIQPGPNLLAVTWNTAQFSRTFDARKENLLLAYWTDGENRIIDSAARPLNTFTFDAIAKGDYKTLQPLDFGTMQQNTLLQKDLCLANVGSLDLQSYVGIESPIPGLTLSQTGSRRIGPADMTCYTITLNTTGLSIGSYDQTLVLRTSDPATPMHNVRVTGTIIPPQGTMSAGPLVHPLEITTTVVNGVAGQWVTFTHGLGPDPSIIHPCRVYITSTLLGVGEKCTDFAAGTASAEMFGDGRDGPSPTTGNLDQANGVAVGTVNGTQGSTNVSVVDRMSIARINPGDVVLIHQTQGTGAGNWELNKAATDITGSGTFQLVNPLKNTYSDGVGNNHAQIQRVPQYSTCNVTGTITPPQAWNGVWGGIVAMMCSQPTNVAGSVNLSGYGFRGGAGGIGGNSPTSAQRHGFQGEGRVGQGSQTSVANDVGGGGGRADIPANDGGGGGGGGSHASNGVNGTIDPIHPFQDYGRGATVLIGDATLGNANFGGGGGGGGTDDDGSTYGGPGGSEGGFAYLATPKLTGGGNVVLSGGAGNSGAPVGKDGGGGGGGAAGGAAKIIAGTVDIDGIYAIGGLGATKVQQSGAGGNGGVGRIRIEYCDIISSSFDPAPSINKLQCHITEQVNGIQSQTRMNVPLDNSRTYAIQYGVLVTSTISTSTAVTLRVPAGLYLSANVQALVSGIGAGTSFTANIGDDGSVEWNAAHIANASSYNSPDLAAAFNAWWATHGSPTTGTMDVPVRISLGSAGQVMLTNLQMQLATATGITLTNASAGYSPLDIQVSTTAAAGAWIAYTHTLGPVPAQLHPVKVLNTGFALQGVGKHATDFAAGTASADMFGDGRDGPMPASGAINHLNGGGNGRVIAGAVGSTNITIEDWNGVSAINPGDKVLIHQTKGAGAGCWEINTAVSDIAGGTATYQLRNPLACNYATNGASNRAQIQRVPQYSSCNVTGSVTAPASWDGNWGGILAVLCRDNMTVSGNMRVNGGNGTDVPVGSNCIESGGAGFGGGFRGGSGFRDHGGEPSCGWGEYGVPGQQGEGINGIGGYSTAANANGGGGGPGGTGGTCCSGGSGGGGGGGGSTNGGTGGGNDGATSGGVGGSAIGTPNLSQLHFGGGGGGAQKFYTYGTAGGGSGGGIIYVAARNLTVFGSISVNGGHGGTSAQPGGGGAGGNVLLVGDVVTIGSGLVTANGGSPGTGQTHAGAGAPGRIAVRYCTSRSGDSTPSANVQQLTCHIAEQIDVTPYNQGRLNVPVAGPGTYRIQYGIRHSYAASSSVTSTLRISAGLHSALAMQALVSGIGGSRNLCVDIGNNGSCEISRTVTNNSTNDSANLAAAFNAYWQANGAPTTGTIDVPIRVVLDGAGQVLLTNVQASTGSSGRKQVRLPVQQYTSVALQATVQNSGTSQITLGGDVGCNGSIEYAWTGSPSTPAQLSIGNISVTNAINTYLAGQPTGDADVPVCFAVAPAVDITLTGVNATPVNRPDATLSASGISFEGGAPALARGADNVVTEGDTLTVTAVISNAGTNELNGAVASFFGVLSGTTVYLGSALAANVLPGGSQAVSLTFSTLGLAGNPAFRVVLDPTARVTETLESNNIATATLNIRTRADLQIVSVTPPAGDLALDEPATITMVSRNAGQTSAPGRGIVLSAGGSPVASIAAPALAAGGLVTHHLVFTPTTLGAMRLAAIEDALSQVNESDRGNNTALLSAYVGMARVREIDSGNALSDTGYTITNTYGAVDVGQPDALGTCGTSTAVNDTFRTDPDRKAYYQFDYVRASEFVHLDVVLNGCSSGGGRTQVIKVNGQQLAGPFDIAGNTVHSISLLLDPALYAGHSISVSIETTSNLGARVNYIALREVDYRYRDAGGAGDSATANWLPTGTASSSNCGPLPSQTARINQNGNTLEHRVDGLNPLKNYIARLVFYQCEGTNIQQQIFLDGIQAGASVLITPNFASVVERVIPPTALVDGSVTLMIRRQSDPLGAFVSEVIIEEQTLSRPDGCAAIPQSSRYSNAGGNVWINGSPAPTGTLITAESPRGHVVGCASVVNLGVYPYMRIIGESTSGGSTIEGMRAGEPVLFRVNGAIAIPDPFFVWQNDLDNHIINLNAGIASGQQILLPPGTWSLISSRVEPVVPLVDSAFSSIRGNFCGVIGRDGVYDCTVPPRQHSLKEFHADQSYYVLPLGNATLSLLIEGVEKPITTPLGLQPGWNYIPYYPHAMLPITQALASIEGMYVRVYGDDGTFEPANLLFSNMFIMRPGRGYLIFMSQAAALTYPASAALLAREDLTLPEPECEGVARTPSFATVFGALTVSGRPAPAGTRVTALAPNGQVVGCGITRADGTYGFLRVFGADSFGTAGMRTGEPMRLRINGGPVVNAGLEWRDDGTPRRINLDGTVRVFLPSVVGE